MSDRWCSPKIIVDPDLGLIEVRPVLPMIETREFQALAGRCQLGLTPIVFPSATHTRFVHSIGSYHGTRELSDRWIKQGFITPEEGDALSAFALYHDIGHAAFSHVTEDFCPLDHKEMTVIHMQNLKSAVEACGVDHELLLSLARHQHPLCAAVMNKTIGMEKFDYLQRDGHSTGRGRPASIDAIRNYVYFVDGMMVIDQKVVDHVIHVQNFYMDMYKGVYLRKALVIAQRAFHKMINHLIVAGELLPSELSEMTDFELMARVITSRLPSVRILNQFSRTRTLFKEAIVLRPHAFVEETRIAEKAISISELSDAEVQRLVTSSSLRKENHAGLEALEDAIADVADIPRGHVLVVPVFYPGRFKAQDVMVLGNSHHIQSLRDLRPKHFAAMEEMARSYVALRVCTVQEHRSHLSSPNIVAKVLPLLFSA
jgi:HD superfamily phosphohydrolase